MSLDIEKMKADGVDPKIIDFVQLSEDELYNKIARRLENDSIFRDFMTGNGDFNSYAVAAGLITEAERKWLADENNPYLENNKVTITFVDESNNLLTELRYEDRNTYIDYMNPLQVIEGNYIKLPNNFSGNDFGIRSWVDQEGIYSDKSPGDMLLATKDMTLICVRYAADQEI